MLTRITIAYTDDLGDHYRIHLNRHGGLETSIHEPGIGWLVADGADSELTDPQLIGILAQATTMIAVQHEKLATIEPPIAQQIT
jgi:hypothetical protein